MKNKIYILIIVFLTYGKGFAGSVDFLNILGEDSTEKMFSPNFNTTSATNGKLIINEMSLENNFCENPSRRCLDYTFPMNSKSKDHEHCAKLFLSHEGSKTYGITTIYFTTTDAYKTTNYLTSQESDYTYLSPINSKFKRLQNLNLEEHFSEPMNPAYYKGFGIRLKI